MQSCAQKCMKQTIHRQDSVCISGPSSKLLWTSVWHSYARGHTAVASPEYACRYDAERGSAWDVLKERIKSQLLFGQCARCWTALNKSVFLYALGLATSIKELKHAKHVDTDAAWCSPSSSWMFMSLSLLVVAWLINARAFGLVLFGLIAIKMTKVGNEWKWMET